MDTHAFWITLWFQTCLSVFSVLVPRILPTISVPSVCPSAHNAFSPILMSQIFWNLVYSLSGIKVRECISSWVFTDLKICLVNDFFWFFNMMFLGIFRSDFQKIVKKRVKIWLSRDQITAIFVLFWPFSQFLGLKFFLNEWNFLIF